jgi:transposase
MIEAIASGVHPMDTVCLADKRLRACKDEIRKALDVDPTDTDYDLINILLEDVKDREATVSKYEENILGCIQDENLSCAGDLLTTLPGVDLIASATIIAEIGVDMDQFKTASRLASWAGMCPGNHESAGRNGDRLQQTNQIDRYIRF